MPDKQLLTLNNSDRLLMEFPYEDIVELPHWESKRHRRMSMENRAAQFAPFAALDGHAEAIADTARSTTERRELADDLHTDADI